MTLARILIIAGLAVVVGACSGASPSSGAIDTSAPAPSVEPTVPAPSGDTISRTFEVDGAPVYLECSGTGSEVTIVDGHLDVRLDHLDGTEEELSAVYAASGDTITFVWPFDWRIGRTSGINTATWSVDTGGTIRFTQTDDEATESWIAAQWVPLSD